jgi:hypothetical protein
LFSLRYTRCGTCLSIFIKNKMFHNCLDVGLPSNAGNTKEAD